MNTVIKSLLLRPSRMRHNTQAAQISNPNGIIEQRFERIGGIDQWIGIRGEDRSNPVLLIAHGGPGSPYSIFNPLIREWEKHFTIVQWDQRGAGKTFGRNGKKKSAPVTFDQIAHDGIEVTEFICQHLDVDKIVLVGNSTGSIIGLRMAAWRPDLFHAYVGTDQNVNMMENQKLTYGIALTGANKKGTPKDIARMEALGPDPARWTSDDLTFKEKMIAKTDTVTEDVISNLHVSSMLASPIHSIGDVGNIGSGLQFSMKEMFKELMAHDAYAISTHFDLPFFIFQGESDKMTPGSLAEKYLNDISAPKKGFVTIPNTGHFAAFLKPDAFLQLLLTHVRPLVK